VREENPSTAMKDMCELFGKTRQAWYKIRLDNEAIDMKKCVVISEVKQIRKQLPRCGLRKLHYKLKNSFKMHNIKMGRDKFADVLREFNLLITKKKGRKTTNSNHRFRRYANTAKDLKITRIDQLWVGDITYIRVGSNFLYLSLLMDVYSRKIVGWSLREDLTHKGPLEALQMALKQRSGKLELTHHFKEEFLQYYHFFNLEQAKQAMKKAVAMYNRVRPHLSLEYKTPNQMYYDSEMQRLANPAQLTLFTSP